MVVSTFEKTTFGTQPFRTALVRKIQRVSILKRSHPESRQLADSLFLKNPIQVDSYWIDRLGPTTPHFKGMSMEVPWTSLTNSELWGIYQSLLQVTYCFFLEKNQVGRLQWVKNQATYEKI